MPRIAAIKQISDYLRNNGNDINSPLTAKEISSGSGVPLPSVYRALRGNKDMAIQGIALHHDTRRQVGEGGNASRVSQYYYSGGSTTEAPDTFDALKFPTLVAIYPTTSSAAAVGVVTDYNAQQMHINTNAMTNEFLMTRIAEVVGPRQWDNIKRCCEGLIELVPQLRSNIDEVSAGDTVLDNELQVGVYERLELIARSAATLMATLQPILQSEDFTPQRIWRMFDQQVPVQMPATIKEL